MPSKGLPAEETLEYLLINENIRDQEKFRKANGTRPPVEATRKTLQAEASFIYFLP